MAILLLFLERLGAHTGACLRHGGASGASLPAVLAPLSVLRKLPRAHGQPGPRVQSLRSTCHSQMPSPRPLFHGLALLLLLPELGCAGAGEALSQGTMHVDRSVTCGSPHRPGRWRPKWGIWLRDVAKSKGRNPWQAAGSRQWAAEVQLRYRTPLKGKWQNHRASPVWQQRRSPKRQGTLK